MNPNEEDFSLPVREDDLWPPGELLHLVGLSYLGQTNRQVVILTLEELRVSLIKTSEDELQPYEANYGRGHTFNTPNLLDTLRYPTSDIARVRISHWGVTRVLTVWIRKEDGREKKILKMFFVEDFPRTIVALAKKACEQEFVKPGIQTARLERKIFDKEVERQFKRAAPNASVVLRGHGLSDEAFHRLVR